VHAWGGGARVCAVEGPHGVTGRTSTFMCLGSSVSGLELIQFFSLPGVPMTIYTHTPTPQHPSVSAG
jgi:hypothetical protein